MTATTALSTTRRRLLTIVLLALAAAAFLSLGATQARQRYLTRGIPALPEPILLGGPQVGVNVYLTAADDDELQSTLEQIAATGIGYVKQSFFYDESADWTAADRFMEAAAASSLTVVPHAKTVYGRKYWEKRFEGGW